ncbi:hypothetical protein FKP32DRAFT_284275 [Trametes sanguinea]|nr:hypothetical protein FKP32DRAFT_284275 [Trametes sanguinea]
MRTPASWHDRSLLEDDPFASEFFIRQMYMGPSESRRRNDWCKQLAKDIKKTPELQAIADRWTAYAFAPEGVSPALQLLANGKRQNTVDLTEVFVRFYWAWYNDETGVAALKVVNDARKVRGYAYRLPNIPVDTLNRSAIILEPSGTGMDSCAGNTADPLESHTAGETVEGNAGTCTNAEGVATSMYTEASSLKWLKNFDNPDSSVDAPVASTEAASLVDNGTGVIDGMPISSQGSCVVSLHHLATAPHPSTASTEVTLWFSL